MRSAAVLILIAFIALALSGCGASVAEFAPAPVEGVLAAAAELLPGEDSAAFTFTAPAGCELRARVLRWDGEWLGCGEAAVFSAPDEGALVLSFDSVAGGFAASLTDAEGAVQARQRFVSDAAPRGEPRRAAYNSEGAELMPGGRFAAVIEYYGGPEGAAADIADFERTDGLGRFDAVYALVIELA